MESNLDHTGLSRERELELEVARLTAELEALGGGDPAHATTRLLEMAAATADAVVADARREADEIIAETSAEAEARRDEATRVAAEAEAMAERKLAEADEAQEIVDRANQDADAIREAAARDADEIVAAGREASAAESARLDESRAALAAEREALTSFHESLQRRVQELAESMVTFMSAELPGTTIASLGAGADLATGWAVPADDEVSVDEVSVDEASSDQVSSDQVWTDQVSADEVTDAEAHRADHDDDHRHQEWHVIEVEAHDEIEPELEIESGIEADAADVESGPAETPATTDEAWNEGDDEVTEIADEVIDDRIDEAAGEQDDDVEAEVAVADEAVVAEEVAVDDRPAADPWAAALETAIPDDETEPAPAGPWAEVTSPAPSPGEEPAAPVAEFGGAPVVETEGDAVIDDQPVDRFDKVTPSGSGLFARLWRGSATTRADDFSDLSGGDELETAPDAPTPTAETGLFDMFGSEGRHHVQSTSPDVLAEALDHDDDHDAAFDDFLRGDEDPDPSRDWLLRPESS